jgi:hypothetical protein
MMNFLTMSSSLELRAALVQLEETTKTSQRSSLKGLAMILLRHYLPMLLSATGSIIKASNFGRLVVAPVKAVTWAGATVARLFAENPAEDEEQAQRLTGSSAGQRRNEKIKAKADSEDPALLGAPSLRLPRLVLAEGHLVPYNQLHADLLNRLGAENVPKDVIQAVEINRDRTTRVVIMCVTSHMVCDLLSEDDNTHQWQPSPRSKSRKTKAAELVGPEDCPVPDKVLPHAFVWGPFSWTDIREIRWRPSEQNGDSSQKEKPPRNWEVSLVDPAEQAGRKRRGSRTVQRGRRTDSGHPQLLCFPAGTLKEKDARNLLAIAIRMVQFKHQQPHEMSRRSETG